MFHKGLHRMPASLKTSRLRDHGGRHEGFPREEKSTGPWLHF
jgi:hypothetical protein